MPGLGHLSQGNSSGKSPSHLKAGSRQTWISALLEAVPPISPLPKIARGPRINTTVQTEVVGCSRNVIRPMDQASCVSEKKHIGVYY